MLALFVVFLLQFNQLSVNSLSLLLKKIFDTLSFQTNRHVQWHPKQECVERRSKCFITIPRQKLVRALSLAVAVETKINSARKGSVKRFVEVRTSELEEQINFVSTNVNAF